MFLLAALAASAMTVLPLRPPADTVLRASQSPACLLGPGASGGVAENLAAALEVHGGAVRWDLAQGPIRIWMQRRPDFAGDVSVTSAEWRRAVVAAADAWRDAIPGLAFTNVPDSARAEVVVTWEHDLKTAPTSDDLAFRTAGRTTLIPTNDGRALLAHVRLAVFAPGAVRYTIDDVRAVARHEIGHAIGLAHHREPASVMATTVRAERLTDDDRATVRALYALPIGARCSDRDIHSH